MSTPTMVTAKAAMTIPAPGTIGARLKCAPYGVTIGLALQQQNKWAGRKGPVLVLREDDNLD